MDLDSSKISNEVLYNRDLLLLIISKMCIFDIINLLRTNKLFYKMIKNNIIHVINNLSTDYVFNKQFLVLYLANPSIFYQKYSNENVYNNFNEKITEFLMFKEFVLEEQFHNERIEDKLYWEEWKNDSTTLIEKCCSYYKCKKKNCRSCILLKNIFKSDYKHKFDKLKTIQDSGKLHKFYKGKFRVEHYKFDSRNLFKIEHFVDKFILNESFKFYKLDYPDFDYNKEIEKDIEQSRYYLHGINPVESIDEITNEQENLPNIQDQEWSMQNQEWPIQDQEWPMQNQEW